MDARRVLLLVGLALFAGGLLFGFLPRTVSGVSCGSAFVENRNAWVADVGNAIGGRATDVGGRCSDAQSSGRIFAFVLLGIGVTLAVGSEFVAAGQARQAGGPTDG